MRKSFAIAIHTLYIDDRWRDELPVLKGRRVELREISFDDVPSIELLIASDPKVTQYTAPPPASIRALQGFVAWAHQQRAAGKFVCYAVVPTGLRHAVGMFQVRKLQPDFALAEWGFALGSAFWGTGIFEDAAVLVADFAFDTLGVHRLEARAVTANGRANGALTKIGATGEAVLRAGLKRGNVLLTQYMWSIRAEEWRKRREAIRPQFSAEQVERQIQEAVAAAERALASAPAVDSPEPSVTPHPFFIAERKE